MSDDDQDAPLQVLLERHDQLTAACRSSGSLFEDPDFPASDKSLTFAAKSSGYQWLRPKQINPKAIFIHQGFSRSDISQGGLGDCWILAAMAGMAEHKEIVTRVVPDGQSLDDGYSGAFRFRMRKFGKEIEVLVDDRLPTKSGKPVYTDPLNGEFWVCLLEKALAKMYGCYESLEGGYIFEALADLTGGLCEEIKLADWRSNLSELARHIDKCLNQKGSIAGASSIPSDNNDDYEMGNGLVYSHAYTVTGLKPIQVKSGAALGKWRQLDLIRVRNPWGQTEWRGDWSDTYKGWSDDQIRAVQLVSRDDGEFWMSFDDFAKFYRAVTIVHFGIPVDVEKPPTPGSSDWRCYNFNGEWKRGKTAGGQPKFSDTHFSNPQFPVSLVDSQTDDDDKATCLVSVEEPDKRNLQQRRREYVAKAVFLYKLPDGKDRVDGGSRVSAEANSCPFTQSRTHVYRFRVQPGRYAVMPCAFEPEEEAQFLLKIFTEV